MKDIDFWNLEDDDFSSLIEPEEPRYAADEHFGPERQAERELNRLMNKYSPGTDLEVPWQHGRCYAPRIQREGIHPNLWSSPPGTTASAEAARLCFECPIRLQCLEFACATKEPECIWGGLEPKVRCNDRDSTTKNHDFEALKGLSNPYADPEGVYAKKALIPWDAVNDLEGEEPEGVILEGYPHHIVTKAGAVWSTNSSDNPVRARPLTLYFGGQTVRVHLRQDNIVRSSDKLPLAEVVAAAYLDYPLNSGIPVEHINGDITDNRVENLTWMENPNE